MIFSLIIGFVAFMLPVSFSSTIPAVDAKLGNYFGYMIDASLFVSGSNPQVKFQASQIGYPDLPIWLKLEQNQETDEAYIYGTPEDEKVKSVEIEIIGWNKKDYSTERKTMTINIDTSEEPPRYQADFKVTNKEIDKFLENNHPQRFLRKLQEIWKPVSLTKVEGAPDRGGRYPLPGEGKEGVYVRAGSVTEYQSLEDATDCKGLKAYNPFPPTYTIDWCNLTLIDLEKIKAEKDKETVDNTTTGAITALSFEPIDYDESRSDLFTVFILVVIIPIIIGIILFIILSCIMFGGREGVAERDSRTPHEQILHHHSIRRATFRLREMSKPQPATETDASRTPPTARSHGPPPSESGSEAGESDRSAPPPYRMPPSFPAGSPGNTRQQPPPFMRSGSMS